MKPRAILVFQMPEPHDGWVAKSQDVPMPCAGIGETANEALLNLMQAAADLACRPSSPITSQV